MRQQRVRHTSGYVAVKLRPNDPLYHMANSSSIVLEHRYVMAQALDRLLVRKEIVHHKNWVKDDNRLENLELLTPQIHASLRRKAEPKPVITRQVQRPLLRISEVSARLGFSQERVHHLIKQRELRAVNVSPSRTATLLRIEEQELQDFIEGNRTE